MWLILFLAAAAALPAEHLPAQQQRPLQDLRHVQDALLRVAREHAQCVRDLQAFNSFHKSREGVLETLNTYEACIGNSGNALTVSESYHASIVNMSTTSSNKRWLCLPSSCPDALLQAALASLASVSPTTSISSAAEGLFDNLGPQHWIVLVVVLILIGFPIILTIYEDSLTSSLPADSRWRRPLLAFSMRSGYSRLVAPDSPSTITCLHGIRVFSSAYIVFGHITAANSIASSPEQTKGEVGYVFVQNYFLAVDSFLCVAGMLNANSLMKQLNGTTKFNYFSYFVHRWFRITPLLFVVCIFAATWDETALVSTATYSGEYSCSPHWWIQLLYLSNYIFPKGKCSVLEHTWYLSLDMQLYLLAPLVVLPLVWRPRWGRVWMGLVTLLSLVVPGALAWGYRIGDGSADDAEKLGRMLYDPIQSRAGPYLVGMIVGCLMYYWKNGTINFNPSKAVCRMLLFCSVLLLLGTLFLTYPFVVAPMSFNGVAAFFFYGCYRSLWSCGILLMVVACERNGGGIVNSFLSWRGFTIPSRLTYSIYLFHLHMVAIAMSGTEATWYFAVRDTVTVFCFTTALAYLTFLCVEQPFASLEAAIRHKPHKAQEHKQQPIRSPEVVGNC